MRSHTRWSHDSDHTPVSAKFRFHLAFGRKRGRTSGRTKLSKPTPEEGRNLSQSILDTIRCWDDWSDRMPQLVKAQLGSTHSPAKRHWLRTTTLQLLESNARTRAEQNGNLQETTRLTRLFRKQARKDKTVLYTEELLAIKTIIITVSYLIPGN